jgi:outer membrane protein OmpA-like peptidoglycan-associated protein
VPGPADHGGCVPEAVHKITGPITAIRFKRDSAVLLQASSAALDEVVKALKEFGGVRLRIEGHADESLDAERNRTVSQARAEAVRDYLVGKGVDAGRLEAVGYGDTRPREGTQGRKSRAIELVPIGAGKP